MKFSIDVSAVAGALKIAAKQDIRYYLNGILLEFDTRTVVATDGHCLIAIKGAIADMEPGDENQAPVIMPREFAEALIKAGKKPRMIALPCDLTGDTLSFTWGATQSIKVIDGKFPEWRRIVPDKLSGDAAQFDPELLARVAKAIEAAGGGKFSTLHSNGLSAAVMSGCSSTDILAVVMPWRQGESEARPVCLSVAYGPAPEEVTNTACIECGSTDIPLHTNNVCGNCFKEKTEEAVAA